MSLDERETNRISLLAIFLHEKNNSLRKKLFDMNNCIFFIENHQDDVRQKTCRQQKIFKTLVERLFSTSYSK